MQRTVLVALLVIAVQQNVKPQKIDITSPGAFADLSADGNMPQAGHIAIINQFADFVATKLHLGAPVVASNVAGIPDALRDGCGVLVPPKNTAALADALETLLRNPEQRREIAIRARRRTEERYDLWQNGARLAQLLSNSRRRATPAAPAAESQGAPLSSESPAC